MKISEKLFRSVLLASVMALSAGTMHAASDAKDFSLTPIGRYTNNAPFDRSAAEIVKHDPATQRLVVVNARDKRLDVLDIANPAQPTLSGSADLSAYGPIINGVSIHGGLIVACVENAVVTTPGKAVFLDSGLNVVKVVEVGIQPDMLIFTPDGLRVLVANEGQPNTYNNFGSSTNGPSVDPEGSISIIDLSAGVANATVSTATFTAFNGATLDPSIRVFGPNATVAQDFEPENITVSPDSTTAYVTLQENNAIAVVDIASATVTGLFGLGFKDHSLAGNGLDASDQDGANNIRSWDRLKGMYQPDGIKSYQFHGELYLVIGNEGDARDYPGYREDVRVSTLTLDPTAFPDPAVKQTNNLGRLLVTKANGDIDGDGDYDELYAFGGRSFSILGASGEFVFDSGDQLEQLTATLFPTRFNCSNNNNTRDSRSPSKGPEPEEVAIGKVSGRTLAFIGLERIGGIAVYDISDPFDVGIIDYVNTRVFTTPFNFATAGDLGPEGLTFISADDSPNGKPLLVVANEVSGSVVIYQVNRTKAKREL